MSFVGFEGQPQMKPLFWGLPPKKPPPSVFCKSRGFVEASPTGRTRRLEEDGVLAGERRGDEQKGLVVGDKCLFVASAAEEAVF